MTPVVKLSPAQRDALKFAVSTGYHCDKPEGRLSMGGISSPTLRLLREFALIERGEFIRDPKDRAVLESQRADRIQGARVSLAAGDWRMALSELRRASEAQGLLDRMADWITDAGREALDGLQK